MAVLFALVAAVAFGLSDFVAGLLARSARVFLVTVVAQTTSCALTWCATPFAGGTVTPASVLWGALAGVGSTGGAMFLYHGLARGRMSVVGPLSAVVTAAGSAVAGIALGDKPSVVQITGMACACLSVAFVSASDDATSRYDHAALRRSLLDALLAGCGFVLFFVALNRAGSGAGLWPVAVSQSTGLVMAAAGAAIVLSVRGLDRREARAVFPAAMSVGALGGGATIAYFVATHAGLLSVSAVITSLYPAATVVPAMVLLQERIRRLQAAGLALAALSVALLAG